MLERSIRILTAIALAATALYVLWFTYQFGQTRFFTIDEYQYGHVTWMVSQGKLPYLDFYEHHFPFGYLLHAPFLLEDGSFAERALFLRKFTFAYLLLTASFLGLATFTSTKNLFAGLLSVALPLSFGFSLMSAIDYRVDIWASCLSLVCLALLEMNRERASRVVAIVCGVLCALAILMTQKMVYLAGGAIALMLIPNIIELVRGSNPWPGVPLIARPWHFVGAGVAVGVVALGLSAATGSLSEFIEITLIQALEHEEYYTSFSPMKYFPRFLSETGVSTVGIALAAAFLLVRTKCTDFWSIPLLVALPSGFLIQAPYPYNFVHVFFLLSLCGVRGFTLLMEQPWLGEFRQKAWFPLLFLIPVAGVFNQLSFVAETTSNEHQLRILEKIERYTDEEDVVIDDAGSALFRPDRGFYWYHDYAHVKMFDEYFSGQFIEDMRATRAPMWIYGMRFNILPVQARAYIASHYTQLDSSLFGLGFQLPRNRSARPIERKIDVVREGEYSILRDPLGAAPGKGHLLLDGEPIVGDRIHLEERVYELTIQPGAPAYVISYFPIEAYGNEGKGLPQQMLFEYESRTLPENRDAVPPYLRGKP